MLRRRNFALTGVCVALTVLTGCEREPEEPMQQHEPTTSSTTFDGDADAAMDAVNALLRDAQDALDEEFGDLAWEDRDQPLNGPEGSGCRLSATPRWTSQYLGRNAEDHPAIRRALTTAAHKHGLPPAPELTSGTGGWLNSTVEGHGLRLEFSAKGGARLSASVLIDGACPI